MEASQSLWTTRDWAKVLLIGCAVFLLCFNEGRALHFGYMNWQTDQGCYLQHLGELIGIKGEDVCTVWSYNEHANGVAIVWALPGLLAKFIAHFRHEDVTQWVLTAAALTSYACWVLAIFFTSRILTIKAPSVIPKAWAPLFALFILLNAYTLHYATADPIMSHAVEAMVAFGCVYFVLKDELLISLVFALLLTVTRYNDTPVVLLLLGRLIDRKGGGLSALRSLSSSQKIIFGTGAALILSIGVWVAFFRGYYTQTLPEMLQDVRWGHFESFLYSTHWGMLWSGSWWLGALAVGAWRFPRSTYLSRAATIWLFLGATLVIVWGGNGTDFGNRYLIGSYAAALVVWLEALESAAAVDWRRTLFQALTWINGGWVAIMTVLYATRPQMSPTWERGVCFLPTNITGEIFSNILNLDAYMTAAFRQLMPLTLYYSRFPNRLPAGRELVPAVGVEYSILLTVSIACGLYILAYLLSIIGSLAYRKASQRAGIESPRSA